MCSKSVEPAGAIFGTWIESIMIRRRIRRLYKRFLKPIVKPSVKWSRKRLRSARASLAYTRALLASLLRQPASLYYVPTWIESLRFSGPPLAVHVPNWPYIATRYVEKQLHRLNYQATVRERGARPPWFGTCRRRAVVFEYGGGSSTLWLAERVQSLTTIEHDAGWFTRIEQALAATGRTNCTVLLRQPQDMETAPGTPSDNDIDYHSDKCPGTFAGYVQTIDQFPDSSFDVVFVDGRSRAACLHHAAGKVRPGGLLVLDDSNRESYQAAMQCLRGWVRKDFCGIKPFQSRLGYTTCWTKPESTPELGPSATPTARTLSTQTVMK